MQDRPLETNDASHPGGVERVGHGLDLLGEREFGLAAPPATGVLDRHQSPCWSFPEARMP